jgi:hypothetical protein
MVVSGQTDMNHLGKCYHTQLSNQLRTLTVALSTPALM